MVERVSTGVSELDGVLSGGFPKGRTVLVSGTAGTGKTILAMHFLYQGAMNGEPGIYLTLEEDPESLREEMAQLGMDITALEAEGKLSIIDASLIRLGLDSDEKRTISPEKFSINHLVKEILKEANAKGVKRIVVDALPSLDILFGGDNDKIRDAIIKINYFLKKNGMTSILLSEMPVGSLGYSLHGVEEYVVDGVITLEYTASGSDSQRVLTVRKMRMTPHEGRKNLFEIMDGRGIVFSGIGK